ncbi:MAG: 1-acyl-sn-glycerol-3-phosphate acyltransferase [Bacteroidetes bacterium]|nr:1-acyl-sn-glycerol-3-phosphate acyltransferase [Bacteroidota bacterium]
MKIFRKLWAIYGILVFFLLWLLFFPFYYLAFLTFPRRWRRHIIWFSHHIYTRLFFGLTLVRFKIEGRENLDPGQTYILVSNHLTSLDFMINARAYPGVYKFLAKRELVKVPVFGFIVRKLCVLVDRSSAASRSASMKFLHKTLEEGYSVFLYPEGTRNRSAEPLLPFHNGAFRIAIESGKPIAVQTLIGVKKISGPTAGLDLWPGTVRVVWGKPLEVSGLTLKDVDTLAGQVREVMLKNLETYSKA